MNLQESGSVLNQKRLCPEFYVFPGSLCKYKMNVYLHKDVHMYVCMYVCMHVLYSIRIVNSYHFYKPLNLIVCSGKTSQVVCVNIKFMHLENAV